MMTVLQVDEDVRINLLFARRLLAVVEDDSSFIVLVVGVAAILLDG